MSSSSSGRGIKRDRSGSSKASTSKAADLALLDDLANKDVFDALVKEEEDLEAAAGIDLNLEDGTAAEVPVTQDKEIYRWIVEELWRVAVQRFDAGEISRFLTYYHECILYYGKTHFLQSPDHHYQFQKKAFPVGYGDPPKPWQSRSCIDYLHTMVLLEAHGEQFYISLQHAKFLGMAAMNDKLSRTLREHDYSTLATLSAENVSMEYVRHSDRRVVYLWNSLGQLLVGMTIDAAERRGAYLRKEGLSKKVAAQDEILDISQWSFQLLFRGPPNFPAALLYSFESDCILLLGTHWHGLNTRCIDAARLGAVMSTAQARMVYRKLVEYMSVVTVPGREVPASHNQKAWNAIIGDSLGKDVIFPSGTYWESIFRKTWPSLEYERKFVWKPEHFPSKQLPVRMRSKEEQAKRPTYAPITNNEPISAVQPVPSSFKSGGNLLNHNAFSKFRKGGK